MLKTLHVMASTRHQEPRQCYLLHAFPTKTCSQSIYSHGFDAAR